MSFKKGFLSGLIERQEVIDIVDPTVWNFLRRECGCLLFLPFDLVFLAVWFSQRRVNKLGHPATWEAILVSLHLVLGIFIL